MAADDAMIIIADAKIQQVIDRIEDFPISRSIGVMVSADEDDPTSVESVSDRCGESSFLLCRTLITDEVPEVKQQIVGADDGVEVSDDRVLHGSGVWERTVETGTCVGLAEVSISSDKGPTGGLKNGLFHGSARDGDSESEEDLVSFCITSGDI